MNPSLSLKTGAAIAHLLRQTLIDHPPPVQQRTLPSGPGAQQLGHYLLSLGYLTSLQLRTALDAQRMSAVTGQPQLLGEILVRAQLIPAPVLTTILLLQMVDRMLDPTWVPQLLGEELVAQGVIQPTELIPALQQQSRLRQEGRGVPLGELLVQQGLLDTHQISDSLAMQHRRSQLRKAHAICDLDALKRGDLFDLPTADSRSGGFTAAAYH